MLSQAQASQSDKTPAVVGHMPEASGLNYRTEESGRLIDALPRANRPLTVSWTYADTDGDKEKTEVKWFLDGELIQNQNAQTGQFRAWLPSDALNKTLKVEVTPGSVSPASPASGKTISFTERVVDSDGNCPSGVRRNINGKLWSCPPKWKMDWSYADTYCKGQNGRLPTADELIAVIPSGGEYAVCHRYGWPQHLSCGGGDDSDFYWSSSAGLYGSHLRINMYDGSRQAVNNTNELHVTCVF